MNQPHPPIPEPQPTPSDEPRTQSILLPPSQRPAGQPGEPGPADRGPWSADQDPASSYRPTGPMDFAPGATDRPAPPSGSSAAARPPVGPSTSPGAPPAGTAGRRDRSPRTRLGSAGRSSTAVASLALGVLGLVLLEIGLSLDFGTRSLWHVVPTWSVFATVAAILVLLPAVAGLTGRLPHRTAWSIGAMGLVGVATAWVLVGLPLAASDRGFWLTAAVGASGAALWLAPGRSE